MSHRVLNPAIKSALGNATAIAVRLLGLLFKGNRSRKDSMTPKKANVKAKTSNVTTIDELTILIVSFVSELTFNPLAF